MHSRQFSLSKPSIRRAVSLLVLVAVCAAAVPIPIAVIHRPAKDSSQPFPCQHCSCGCKDAEQCWLNCCCYSADQKLAWANANGVTPPWYAAKGTSANKPEADGNKAARSPAKLCEKCKPTQAVACNRCDSASHKSAACCGAKSACTNTEASSGQTDTEATFVLSMMAVKCKGGANLYTHLPWAIVSNIQPESLVIEILGRHTPAIALKPARVFLVPDVPPPRGLFSLA